MFALFFCHWKLKGAVPSAPTVKVADCPTVTAWLTGCVAIVGAEDADPLPEFGVLIPTVAQPANRNAKRIAIRFKLNGDRDTSSHPCTQKLSLS